MTIRIRAGLAISVALVGLAGCTPVASPVPTETIDFTGPPHWVDDEDLVETRVSFAAGADLVPGSRVEFGSRLGEIYDWAVVGGPTAELTQLVNPNAGCRVRDETSVYTGSADDETASRELVTGLLADAEIIGGPQRSVAGIGEGLGEGAPMYDVMHALGSTSDGYVYVTGRVFAALGIQHAITLRCELGGYLDWSRSQISTTTWVDLDLPEGPDVPVVSAPTCTRDQLTMLYSPLLDDATSITGVLQYRNDSSVTCSVTGYPVLYFSSPESAETWGAFATHDPSTPPRVANLTPGWTASAIVTIRRADVECPETLATDGFVAGVPSDDFDLQADGRHIAVSGLEVCSDSSVGLLTVEAMSS